MNIIKLIDKKTNIEYYKPDIELLYNIKSGSNISKRCLLINNVIKVTKYFDIYFVCDICGSKQKLKNGPFIKMFEKNHLLCSKCKRKETNLERYGVENVLQDKEKLLKMQNTMIKRYGVQNYYQFHEIREKAKQTNLKRYGVEYPTQSKEIHKKIKQTNLKRYGVEYPTQSKEIHKKIKETNLERYGVEYAFQNETICIKAKNKKFIKYGTESYNNAEKAKQTNLKRYGVEYPMQLEEVKKKKKEKSKNTMYNKLVNNNIIKPMFERSEYKSIFKLYKWQCKKCNTIFEDNLICGHIPRCPACYPPLSGSSIAEKEISTWIKSLNIIIEENNRSILNGKELDIYIPSHNLAIEFNGIYWHSELNGKDKNYHLNKTIECNKQGIHLIHIFEDEWIDKQEIVKSIIKMKLGMVDRRIGARKTVIKEIKNKEVSNFYDENHLQGSINSKINIGLFYEDELISCLSFSKPRYNKKYNWEITRFANLKGISIIGGFSKLLKYFISNYEGSIITYSDRRIFTGSVYRNNGFEELESSSPGYQYVKNGQRYNRQQFMKHKLEKKLKIYNSELTEWENMQINGWDRVWDCGNYIFIRKDKEIIK